MQKFIGNTSKLTNKSSVNDWMKRLKEWHSELKNMTQGQVELNSLETVAMTLSQSYLLEHKDRGIRIMTACCLADILRLFAPQPPYNEKTLQNVMKGIIQALKGIAHLQDAYYSRCFYLLENLSLVKTCLILNDMMTIERDGGNEYLEEMQNENYNDENESQTNNETKKRPRAAISTMGEEHFGLSMLEELFCIFSESITEEHSKNVTMAMIEIMHHVMEEGDVITHGMMDKLVLPLTERRKKEAPMIYKMMGEVIGRTWMRLQLPLSQWIADGVSGKRRDDLEDVNLEGIHQIIYELYKVAPNVLLSVMPLLNEELKVEQLDVRLLATKTLGMMMTEEGSGMAERYPQVWLAWLNRCHDIQTNVRMVVVHYIGNIYRYHPKLMAQVNEMIKQRLFDTEEKVRMYVIRIFRELKEVTLLQQIDIEVIKVACERCLDKKANVREEAINFLGTLSAALINISEESEMNQENRLSEYVALEERRIWLVSFFFRLFSRKEADICCHLEKVLDEMILGVDKTVEQRIKKFIKLFSFADQSSRQQFICQLKGQKQATSNVLLLLELLSVPDAQRSIEFSKRLTAALTHLAKLLPDQSKAFEQLKALCEIGDEELYLLLSRCCDARQHYQDYREWINAIMEKIAKSKAHHVADILMPLLRRVSLLVVGNDNITHLLDQLHKLNHEKSVNDTENTKGNKHSRVMVTSESKLLSQKDNFQKNIIQLLTMVITVYPELLANHVNQLCSLFGDHISEEGMIADLVTLLYKLCKAMKFQLELPAMFSSYLDRLSTSNHLSIIKHSSMLSMLRHDEKQKTKLLNDACKHLIYEDPTHQKYLTILCAIAQQRNDLFKTRANLISEFILGELLTRRSDKGVNKRDLVKHGLEWTSFMELAPHDRSIILGIKVLTHYLRFSGDKIIANETITKFLAVLEETEVFVEHGSGINPIKLAIATSMLYLGTHPILDAVISETAFIKLALCIQDQFFPFRERFAEKLKKLCLPHAHFLIPLRYMNIFFLMAYEPEKDLLLRIKAFVSGCLRRRAMTMKHSDMEIPFLDCLVGHFSYLLSHHPDFIQDIDGFGLFERYIQFFLEIVADADNISTLFHAFLSLKRYQDIHFPDSKAIYALSDLAQKIIKEYCRSHQWALTTPSRTILLPKNLYEIMNEANAQSNLLRSYLPDKIKSISSNISPPKKPKLTSTIPSSPSVPTRINQTRVAKSSIRNFFIAPTSEEEDD